VGNPHTEERSPVVMDKNPGDQVWNYVIVDYRMTSGTVSGNTDQTRVTTEITYLDYGPCSPGYRGSEKRNVTYTYWISGDFENPAAGQWTGDSVADHPHFFWYPDYQKTEYGCPIDYNIVKAILQ
jgi:hypothetical protein